MAQRSSGVLDLTRIGFVSLRRTHYTEYLGSGSAADVWKVSRPESSRGLPSLYVSKVIRISSDDFKHIPEYVGSTNKGTPSESPHVPDTEKFSWKAFVDTYSHKVLQWSSLRHENVIRVYGHDQSLNLHVDFCPNGTVRDALRTPGGKRKDKWEIVSEILAGLKYLHGQSPPIVHGNLNAGKLFFDSNYTTKIGEFGLAALFYHISPFVPSISFDGFSRWMSPELLEIDPSTKSSVPPTTQSDVWAMACTILEVFTENLPFSRYNLDFQIMSAILSGEIPGSRDDLPSDHHFSTLWWILKRCWSGDRLLRPNVGALLLEFRTSAPMNHVPQDQSIPTETTPGQTDRGWVDGPNTAGESQVVVISWEAARLLLQHRLFFLNSKPNQRTEMYCWCISYTGFEEESQLWHVNIDISGMPFRFQLRERLLHSHFNQGQAVLMGYRLVLPNRSSNLRTLYDPMGSFVSLYKDVEVACRQLVAIYSLAFTTQMEEHSTSPLPKKTPEVDPYSGTTPTLTSGRVGPDYGQRSLPTGSTGVQGISSSLGEHFQASVIPRTFTPTETSVGTDIKDPDESKSNSDPTGNTSPDRKEIPRPRSPIAKGDPFEIDWELAAIILPHRSFFLSYNEDTFFYEMYCWSIVYGPTVTEDTNIESQFWHVTPNHAGFRFQLRHRIAHSRLTGGVAFAMGHRLDLSNQNLNLRALSKFPGFTPVTLYDDILASYQASIIINDTNFEQNTSAPVANLNSGVNPGHSHPPMHLDSNLSQGPSSAGVIKTEATTPSSSSAQLPPTPRSTGAGSVAPDDVGMWMDVGDTIPTEAQVKLFTANFRKNGPGKGAHVVVCLHCPPNSDRRRITDPRPWYLARHLMSHFRNSSEQ